MTQIWTTGNNGLVRIEQVPTLRVRVIRQHRLKAPGFLEKTAGLVFNVVVKREGGYDVDMGPLGRPGEWGFMFADEVEEVSANDSSGPA